MRLYEIIIGGTKLNIVADNVSIALTLAIEFWQAKLNTQERIDIGDKSIEYVYSIVEKARIDTMQIK